MKMKARQRLGRRYLAGLVMALAVLFNLVGTLGPARHSPYYWVIVPVPAVIAVLLGARAWTTEKNSTAYSAAALGLLLCVLFFSHLLPRSHT